MNNLNASIGADPEIFLTINGVIESVVGKLGGTKNHPLPVECGALQEDNMLAEFNIDPASDVAAFRNNINTVLGALVTKGDGYGYCVKASHHFDKEVILDGGDQALEFGCDPDWNCWTGEENPKPNPFTTLRTAGGHIHVGYDNPSEEQSVRIVQLCDYLLGLPSVLLDPDNTRRELYGKAGAFRIKPYGVEYRTLSNFWLGSEELQTWAYKQAVLACELSHDSVVIDQLTTALDSGVLEHIINTCDAEQAEFYFNQFNIGQWP